MMWVINTARNTRHKEQIGLRRETAQSPERLAFPLLVPHSSKPQGLRHLAQSRDLSRIFFVFA